MSTHADLIRKCYKAYEAKDKAALELLLADDFTFSSPLDDNISRETYFSRCWPNSKHQRHFEIEQLVEGDEGVFVTYNCERMDGVHFRNTEYFTFESGKIRHVDVYFGRQEDQPTNEQAIRDLMEGMAAACRKKDVEALVSHYAPDLVAFDLLEPLQYRSSAEVAKRATTWLTSFEGPISYDMAELCITAGEDTAFAHCLNHVQGTNKEGQKIDMWWRETACFHKTDEQWLVTHMHSSEPFDMVTGKALTGLKP